MNIKLTRAASSQLGTFGVLSIDEIPFCLTCEDPWNNNQTNISCIPKGLYVCRKYSSARFPDVWQLMDVPGRSAILIHAGNTIDDTHGCILVGSQFGMVNNKPAVINSRATLDMLRRNLPEQFALVIA